MVSSISIVDIIAGILIVTGIIHGYRQGVSPAFSWFCGSLIGLACGVVTYPFLQRTINASGEVDETLLAFCSLMGSVMVIVLVLFFIRYLLAQIARFATTLILDRIGGAIAGFVQTAAIIVLAYVALTSVDQPTLHKIFGEESAIGRPILAIKQRVGLAVEADYNKTGNRMLQQREERANERTLPH